MTADTAYDPRRRRAHRRRLRRARAAERRGVLLLVVLSMLVLFLLVGTTFLVTSSQYRTASKIVEKANRSTFQPEDVLERALMQVVRDTNNRNSSIRYHSLLRDFYGVDGFVGSVAVSVDASLINDPLPRYAGASGGDLLGPTEGQFVDFVVRDVDSAGPLADANAVGLDLDANGLPTPYGLQRIDDYYNGCLLTMLDGPCRGDSVRVIDYDYLGLDPDPDPDLDGPALVGPAPVGRFRVMAPRRVDGRPLTVDAGGGTLVDFLRGTATAPQGRRLLVNGRPLNGTGVGFDALASPNSPRLTALEAAQLASTGDWIGTEIALTPNAVYFNPAAAHYLDPGLRRQGFDPFTAPGLVAGTGLGFGLRTLNTGTVPAYPLFPGPGGADESYDAADFQNMFLALQPPQTRVRGRVVPPGSNTSVDPEFYYASNDAAPARLDLEDVTLPSFHRPALVNYWLHRIYRRLVTDGAPEQQAALAVLLPYGPDFVRGTADDPGGVSLEDRDLIVDIKRKAMHRPLPEDHPEFDGSNALSRYGDTALRARFGSATFVNSRGAGPGDDEITFPYWEAVGPWDVDNDRDGAPDSVWVDLGLPIQQTEDGRLYKPLVALLIEDLDGRLNLNAHGSTEHLAADDNFVPDGGLSNDDLDVSRDLGGAVLLGRNLAQDYLAGPALVSSNQLPHGSGWGPADITLRPLLSPDVPLSDYLNGVGGSPDALTADAQYDDYARLLVGRPDPRVDGRNVAPAAGVAVAFGRYGSFPGSGQNAGDPQFYSPGRTFNTATPADVGWSREGFVPYDFAGYPLFATEDLRLSGFGERPDLFSRYGFGLGPNGGPVREAVADGWIDASAGTTRPTLDDSPYELNLSADARRQSVADLQAAIASHGTANPIVDDAPFSPAELERLLRAFDADADKLPDRLWNLVDAFDPQKLAVQNAIAAPAGEPNRINNPDSFNGWTPSSLQTVVAQAEAAINRRLVTTESYDPPAPNENWTARMLLGADGLPGQPALYDGPTLVSGDDDGDGIVDEGDELGLGTFDPTDGVDVNDCDDYQVVMGEPPPPNARITDYLRYRVAIELYRKQFLSFPASPAALDPLVNNILFGPGAIPTADVRTNLGTFGGLLAPGVPTNLGTFGGLLAPEVLAGRRMDVNRPFGDGRDNNGNGVVDEPQEAGEPWIDANGNGVWDGDPFLDLNNDGRFYADADGDGAIVGDEVDDWRDFDGDGVLEPIVDHVWVDANRNGLREQDEFRPFNYTGGVDANGRGSMLSYTDSNGNGQYDFGEPFNGRVVDDAVMARQLYARHLYCLMLALVDQNYLAPYDESDPQVRHYLDPKSGLLDESTEEPTADSSMAYRIAFRLGREATPPTPQLAPSDIDFPPALLASAKFLAQRKLTVRQIAQWAINCVDIRDPDAIQTPFEYDENPWDGWNVVDRAGTPNDTSDDNVYPLDGDVATDENDRWVRRVLAGGFELPSRQSTSGVLTPISETDHSRGVVWGAERPELLMTEGLALHDRRLIDSALPIAEGRPDGEPAQGQDHDLGLINGSGVSGVTDDDLDQLLRPRGSAFVELFNPWSDDDQKPRELYSRQTAFLTLPTNANRAVGYQPDPDRYDLTLGGVALDRLSNASALRRDPARVLSTDPAIAANPTMQVDNRGFRKQPRLGGPPLVTTSLTEAASPVWRVICVEEHPDLRNQIAGDSNEPGSLDDNPYADPANSDSPWGYPTRLPGAPQPNVPQLPRAYDYVADYQENAGQGAPPPLEIPIPPGVVFRQADPDWPAFDRFARPVGVGNGGIAEGTNTTISVAEIPESGAPSNVPVSVDRMRLIKPARHIERAFYFIGAPEIDPPTRPGGLSGRPSNVPTQPRRNVVQPGLLIPDLTYAYDPRGVPGYDLGIVEQQVARDYDHDATQFTATDPIAAPSGLQFYAGPTGRVMAVHGNRFVATDRFDADHDLGLGLGDPLPADNPAVGESLPLAPILPGRYAVIGPAGVPFESSNAVLAIDPNLPVAPDRDAFLEDLRTLANRYTTIISKPFLPRAKSIDWERLRHIELIPSADPDDHQVVVRFNGARTDLNLRSSEVYPLDPANPVDGPTTNLTELSQIGSAFQTVTGDARRIKPAVAIPVDGFNISEPLDGYHLRRYEIFQSLEGGAQNIKVRVAATRENPAGQTLGIGDQQAPAALTGFDQPLDVLDELLVDPAEDGEQITPNYRTLHLQRLANPLLAWNPPPRRPSGEPVAEHDPARPVNPYLTVDSLPMDLIAYNGALVRVPGATQRLTPLASVERGIAPFTPSVDPNADGLKVNPRSASDASDRPFASIDTESLTPRDVWRAAAGLVIDSRREVAAGPLGGRHPDTAVFDGATASASEYDMVLQHSLGFASRGAGALITDAALGGATAVSAVDLNGDGVAGDLVGAPAVDLSNDNAQDVATFDLADDTNGNGVRDPGETYTPGAPDGIPDFLQGIPDDTAAQTLADNDVAPALHWPNRPFVSAAEVMLTPAWSSSRLLTYFSTFNANLPEQPNPYDGEVITDFTGTRISPALIGTADPRATNRARWENQQAPFGHLLNFFQTASGPAQAQPWQNPSNPEDIDVNAYGAPHYYRILDYLQVPSRFVATDTLLNPQTFGQLTPLGDPREALAAPLNRVDDYREPGRVNLNTVVGRRDAVETPSGGLPAAFNSPLYRPADLWSEVYDGLMHRREEYGAIDHANGQLLQAGHLGPAWRDLVVSRRGYLQPTYGVDGLGNPNTGIDYSPGLLHPDFPTLFANPLRAPEAGFNVPLVALQQGGVDASWQRAHPLSPGEDGAWGARSIDDRVVDKDSPPNVAANRDLIDDDSGEAGVFLGATININGDSRPDRDLPLVRRNNSVFTTVPDSLLTSDVTNYNDLIAPTPMFAGASTEPSLNTERNPQLRYGPMTRLANLTTTRSGVFAVWITVGYFEVTPANENPAIWRRFMTDTNGDDVGDVFRAGPPSDPNLFQDLFFRIYQDGYTLGAEIGIETGENRRMRGFYMVDRTLPVAFKPGEDANVENAILLRRRIE